MDGPLLFLLKLKRILLVENIPLLQAEAAEVNTTKLIIPAAIGIPTKLNVLTKHEVVYAVIAANGNMYVDTFRDHIHSPIDKE